MEDINDYWKMMDFPPVFTNIDWNASADPSNNFIPMEYEQQKYQHQPFQRRRSSSVDLPINPLYSNTNRLIMTNNNETIHEEPPFTRSSRIGSSATLEFPGNYNMMTATVSSPLSTASSAAGDMMSPPGPTTQLVKAEEEEQEPKNKQPEQQIITFFPELHRTSYNTILGKQLKQHQKRRRSSSLPPAFHRQKQHHVPTPLIFTQIQVTDPTPVHHTQKAAKIDTRPVAIEKLHKPTPKPVTCDPVETQKKLDDQLIQLNFEDVTVAELKDMLRERGLSATGKKAVLTDRLRDARDALVRQKSTSWIKKTESPNIQGLANMTINSPAPESLFMPIDNMNDRLIYSQNEASSIPPPANTSSYQYQALNNQNQNELMDINELFNFDSNAMLDNNQILFPPSWETADQDALNTAEWGQDKLDLFWTELA